MSPMIPPEVLEEIRSRSDIAAVVESFMPLQRQGNTLKALCPFHKEKTPSFVVNPQRQVFHCFGCGKGGDVFRFVMEYEKLDFIAAVQLLARRAGVSLDRSGGAPAGQTSPREMLFTINQAAARFYQQCLREGPAGESARRYLAARALSERAVEDFMIGYAPDKWDALLAWAGRKFKPALLEQAGLAVQAASRSVGRPHEPHWYDRFRNRLMFPIRDEQGRVIGFSGRSLSGEDQGAKYVNTPETIIFHKGRVLYALDRARRAIADAGRVMICEGQIDVIQCHLAGFDNAVAAQGTAFTEEHARILRRYADNVLLVFDADRAGQNAALRAAEVFLQFGLAVRIATLPQGDDPDSILRRPDGPAVFRQLLEQASPLMAFQINILRRTDDADTEAGRLRAVRAVLAMIQKSPSAVQQSLLLQEAAAALGLPVDVLQRDLRALPPPAAPRPEAPAPGAAPATEPPPARELALTEHLAAEPELASLARQYLPLECITHPLCRRIVELSCEAAAQGCPLAALLSQTAADDETLMHFAARVLAAPPKITSEFATTRESVQNLILSLRSAAVQRRRRELRELLMRAPAGTAGRERQALEEEYAELGYDVARLKNWESALEIM